MPTHFQGWFYLVASSKRGRQGGREGREGGREGLPVKAPTMKPIEEARNAHTLPGMVLSGCVKRARDGGREEGRGGGREDAHKNIPVSAPTMEPMEEARNAHTLPGMVSSG